jgi:hypothetical protein
MCEGEGWDILGRARGRMLERVVDCCVVRVVLVKTDACLRRGHSRGEKSRRSGHS